MSTLPTSRQTGQPAFIERTRQALYQAFRDVTKVARASLRSQAIRPDLPPDDLPNLRNQIDACLAGKGGAASARARAAGLGQLYLTLSPIGRRRFFDLLAQDYGVDPTSVEQAISDWQAATGDNKGTALLALRERLDSPRLKLLSQFNGLEGGVKFLVDLRADLMREARDNPALALVDHELRELLTGWFDVGFLYLRRIDWKAPAALLEKLIAYEAVHEIRSWTDLKNRLDSDRRCFAFFHPSMPDEPLIFVEVALVKGLASNIHGLLDETAPRLDPGDADTAIFYSISNAQAGLAGVGFGDFLIKRVVDELSRDLPDIKNYATLSPIPGLVGWLKSQDINPDTLDDSQWLKQAAVYLYKARRGAQAHDRVAHFHLSNGARIERLNANADLTAKGIRQSGGVMVNYRYKLSDIEANHERYRESGTVAASSDIKRLAEG
jgi:malonyl-CoA decarboxylase